jgi:cyanophycin synthetase
MSVKKNFDCIKRAVRSMGGKIEVISEPRHTYRIILGKKSFIFSIKLLLRDNLITTARLAKCKDLTTAILEEATINTPKTFLIGEKTPVKDLKKIFAKIRFPAVIKDSQGSESRGVFTGIKSTTEGLSIIKKNIPIHKSMLIQETASGKEYRVLVLGDRILGVLELIPPYVVGDGRSSVENLIRKKQAHTPSQTPLDSTLRKILREQKESLNSVPWRDKKVFLRNNSCLAEGGVSVDRTDEIDPKLARICQKAVRLVGLKMAGIDLLCKNLKEGAKNYSIIEINGKPDLYIHHKPSVGKPRNVSLEIIKFIFKKAL